MAGTLVRNPNLFQNARQALLKELPNLEFLPTTGPQDAARIGRECVDRHKDLVLVLGGDGTFHEVLNGVAGSDVMCGVLPGGTANVLSVELGVHGDWIIDLGPEGGHKGGQIVVEGTPETVAQCATSHTGRFLKRLTE